VPVPSNGDFIVKTNEDGAIGAVGIVVVVVVGGSVVVGADVVVVEDIPLNCQSFFLRTFVHL